MVIATFLVFLTLPAHADIIGKPRVIDGDPIHMAGERIRLHGIDAPDAKQICHDRDDKEWHCGEDATFALARFIEFHWITCRGDTRDRYGRLIAVCYAGPYDLNAKMVLVGWALAHRRYSRDYVDAEAETRQARVGMWRGEFVPPWEWRKGKL